MSANSAKKSGFTLPELLVVVAILSILAAILLGVLNRVQEKGRATVCQSNLRQIGLATQLYTGDHGGQFPLSSDGKLRGVQYWPANILPYIESQKIFECPTVDGYFKSYALGSHYLYNTSRLNYTFAEDKSWRSRSIASVGDPARVWVTRDTTYNWYVESINSCGNGNEWPIVHGGGANAVFVDGHVKWLNPEQAGTIQCSLPLLHGYSP